MELLPFLHWMPRVDRDIEGCLEFIARQPWGKPADRHQDIREGIHKILRDPQRSRVRVRRPSSGVELRRHNPAQFVIVYAFMPPNDVMRQGLVSIRAVRHRRLKDVFRGVKEPLACYERKVTPA